MPTSRPTRQNPQTGYAYKGSQRQIQAHVNQPQLTPVLEAAAVAALPGLAGCTFDCGHRWRLRSTTSRATRAFGPPSTAQRSSNPQSTSGLHQVARLGTP
jgi:hypothetical protein